MQLKQCTNSLSAMYMCDTYLAFLLVVKLWIQAGPWINPKSQIRAGGICTLCPKISDPLLQTCLIQFVVHGFQPNIVHCIILTLPIITAIMTYTLYHVCSV